MTDPNASTISLAAYARLRGVSREAVSKAVMKGRLRESVVIVDGKPRIGDVELADREWAASTDLTRAPMSVVARSSGGAAGKPPGDPPSGSAVDGVFDLATETAREKHWKANIAELDYREKAGELVPAAEVAAKFDDILTAAKTKLLGVPARVKQRLPDLRPADVGVIKALIREALEDLAAHAAGGKPDDDAR